MSSALEDELPFADPGIGQRTTASSPRRLVVLGRLHRRAGVVEMTTPISAAIANPERAFADEATTALDEVSGLRVLHLDDGALVEKSAPLHVH